MSNDFQHPPNALQPITLLGVPVHPFTRQQLHSYIVDQARSQQRALILHANVHGLNLAVEQPWLQAFYQRADAVFCDGSGVLIGARLLGARIPERITYADWIWELAALAERAQLSLYLLGAKPGIAEQAATALQARYSELRIAGTHHGYFNKAVHSTENQAVIDAINRSQADILLVCFGMPLQEAWLRDNWSALHTAVGLTGGAALDYAAGNLRRGPALLTRTGFEWLARLLIEPQRLWKRYILGNPLFLYRILRERFKRQGQHKH